MTRNLILFAALATLAGCAQSFPETALTDSEQAFERMLLEEADSPEAQLALGQMYFLHNRIDEADRLLSAAVEGDPGNPQAAAWLAANDCKRAGRRGPWLMGLDKLYLVYRCLSDVDAALERAPNDFVVQMVQMNTDAEVAMFGSLDHARATRERVEERLRQQPDAYPADAVAQFHVTAARIERISGNPDGARAYLERAGSAAASPATREQIALEQRLLTEG